MNWCSSSAAVIGRQARKFVPPLRVASAHILSQAPRPRSSPARWDCRRPRDHGCPSKFRNRGCESAQHSFGLAAWPTISPRQILCENVRLRIHPRKFLSPTDCTPQQPLALHTGLSPFSTSLHLPDLLKRIRPLL